MKRKLSFLLAVVMLVTFNLGSGAIKTHAEYEAPNIYDTKTFVPKLSIENVEIPEVNAGGTLTVKFKMNNIGQYTANDIVITPDIAAINNKGAQVSGGDILEPSTTLGSKKIIAIQKDESEDVVFTFKVKDTTKTGTYPLVLNYTYKNPSRDSYQGTETVYFKVTGNQKKPKLSLENVKTPSNIKADSSFNLSFDVVNSGSNEAKDLKVSLDGLNTNGLTVENLASTNIGLISENGGRKTVSFKLNASSKMDAGSYPVTVKTSYKDEQGTVVEDSNQIFVNIIGEPKSNMNITNIRAPQTSLVSGQPFEVSFDIENYNSQDIENITASIDGGDKIVPKSQNIQKFSKIAGNGSQRVTFVMEALENIDPKNYTMSIEVKFPKRKASEELESIKQFIGVNVGRNSNVVIKNIAVPYSLGEDNGFNLSFDIENLGIGSCKNVKVSAETPKEIVASSQLFEIIDSLEAKETKNVSFALRTAKKVESGSYPIVLKVMYDGAKEPITQNISLYIEKGEKSKTTPKIIINKYSIGSPSAIAGKDFDLSLSFVNTNKAKGVTNIKVFFTTDTNPNDKFGNIFTPVNASNTFFIDELQPNQATEKTITFNTLSKADAKNYTITANIEYEDFDGNAYTTKELINIPVVHQSNIFVSDVNMPENIMVDKPASISLNLYNVGKTAITNMMVKTEGDFKIKYSEYFVGNFQAGDSDTYEVEVIPTKEGELKGKIILSYDLANGKREEVVKEISLNAKKVDEANSKEVLNKKENSLLSNIITIVVVLAVISVAFILIRRHRKNKKGIDLHE